MTATTSSHPDRERPGAEEFVPHTVRLASLARAAQDCRACELFAEATQVVFGEGSRGAPLMLVGEQPGDVEDRRGQPFVGPAGGVLDRALEAAGIERGQVYLTNAVKHFRWKSTAASSRRIHERPATAHITACRPWLRAELASVAPTVVVALGAVAAESLFGPGFRLTRHRGEFQPWPPAGGAFAGDGTAVAEALATIHPSAVLRSDPDQRRQAYEGLVADLRLAAEHSFGSAERADHPVAAS